MKKQSNRIYLGEKVSKKQKIRNAQESAETETVMISFFIAIVVFAIIAVIIFN